MEIYICMYVYVYVTKNQRERNRLGSLDSQAILIGELQAGENPYVKENGCHS